jgi:hypothetical protein
MKKKIIFFIIAFLIAIFAIYFFYSVKSNANNPELKIKIKLQGDFAKSKDLKLPAQIQILSPSRKIKSNSEFVYQLANNLFTTKFSLSNLELPQVYSVFIKPQNYFGRFFPSLPLINGENNFDFSQQYFYYGDINNDGKISNIDLSLIFEDLGNKYSSSNYAMTLYSLSRNVTDEQIVLPQTQITQTSVPTTATVNQNDTTSTPTATSTTNPTLTASPTIPPTSTTAVTIVASTPTLTAAPTPTPSPTATLWPSTTPTITSKPIPWSKLPTTQRSINRNKIIELINQRQLVSCVGSQNCDKNQFNEIPLKKGVGFATYYADESNASNNNIVAIVIKNRKGITIGQARQFISNNLVSSQSNLTPNQAKNTGKVIAFGATRNCADLWSIKYLFGIDDPNNPNPYFIGRVMIVDCASRNSWHNRLSTISYSYKGWQKLPWIIDLSRNGFIKLPTGLSGNKDNLREGRPGVVLIDESVLNEFYQ